MPNDSPPPWRIKSWSRPRGRGVIECTGLEDLPFDASIALVDDFDLGEPVHVHLAKRAEKLVVTKLWPDDPRVAAGAGAEEGAPALDPSLATATNQTLDAMGVYCDYKVAELASDLLILGDDVLFERGHEQEIRCGGPSYIELPMVWSGKAFRLANRAERAYLATKTDVTERDIALKIVDDELRPYFVVCHRLDVVERGEILKPLSPHGAGLKAAG